jgi:hypothetical protein
MSGGPNMIFWKSSPLVLTWAQICVVPGSTTSLHQRKCGGRGLKQNRSITAVKRVKYIGKRDLRSLFARDWCNLNSTFAGIGLKCPFFLKTNHFQLIATIYWISIMIFWIFRTLSIFWENCNILQSKGLIWVNLELKCSLFGKQPIFN